MKVSSISNPAFHGSPLRWVSGFLAICCITLTSCAAKTEKGPQITLLDFKSQNVERLHSGIERLVGEDSAGDAAMEYVRKYEDDLVMNYPVAKDKITPDEPDPNLDPLADFYQHPTPSRFPETNPINPDPEMRRFLDFLKGRRLTAMSDLRKNHEEFQVKGTMSAAKMGLVNAYVATTAAPSPNDIDLIADLVDPMLRALTPR